MAERRRYDDIPLPSASIRRISFSGLSLERRITQLVALCFIGLGVLAVYAPYRLGLNRPLNLLLAVAAWTAALLVARWQGWRRMVSSTKSNSEQTPPTTGQPSPPEGAASTKRFARIPIPEEDATTDGDPFSSFAYWVKQNQAFISNYHDLAHQQARDSFRNCQIAMGVGLAILVAGATLTATSSSVEIKLVFGGLTALASAFSGYVGATFLRAHFRALDQLNYYYGQPVVTNYLLAAERVASTLSGSRDEVLREVVRQALQGAKVASLAAHSDGPLPGKGTRRQAQAKKKGASKQKLDPMTNRKANVDGNVS